MHVHPAALLETDSVGEGTRVGAFAHVEAGAALGRRVTVGSGARLGGGVRTEDDVAIGPNAVFATDDAAGDRPTTLKQGCSVGANATVLPGTTVGARAVVRPGAVVTRDVPPFAIVAGNPASIRGYVAAPAVVPEPSTTGDSAAAAEVGGARLVELPTVHDMRGRMAVAEFDAQLPFVPKRCFIVYDVPSEEIRGEHAHVALHEVVICVRGSVRAVVDDGRRRAELLLDSPSRGLYLPPRVWRTLYRYSRDAMLVVLASEVYRPGDYVRDYDTFLRLVDGA